MDQKKIGLFLKNLRKEKELTQEQLAERFHVSARTVSRWETGRNMPDLSLLVEMADFYDVDVREIMEGEKKSENMNEELKDVAAKLADYADTEKGKLLKWIQGIGFAGVFVMTMAIVLQCIQYRPNLISAGAIGASFAALATLAIITLYVTGVLEKLIRRKGFIIAVKVGTMGLLLLSLMVLFEVWLVFGIGWLDYFLPFQKASGIENYNKPAMIKEYAADMDCGFMVFPDTTEGMLEANFFSSMKTGFMDSDGYLILEAEYSAEEFESEISRLSEITCELKHGEDAVVKSIRYDESTYYYPAYIAVDGYDYAYEYALIDEENDSIVYVSLSYPDVDRLTEFRDYLKKDLSEYDLVNGTVLENFTIYAHRFPGMEGWLEYSDL